MLALFATTIFLSAALLFCVEPMIARMLLPLLGGAPAVWVTCMLFFQSALLAGYSYAHATLSKLGVRRQAVLQLGWLIAPLFVLPIAFDPHATLSWPPDADPSWRLLGMLAAVVGLPFFVLSTTSPMLQAWFARASGKDPYFLYAASNLGSMLALLAYPAIFERWLGLNAQSHAWRVGYVVLVILVAACAASLLWRTRGRAPVAAETEPGEPVASISAGRRVRWVILAFVPSSFLLGTTTYVTTDIAAIPLFWVMPLALYLVTFILVFAHKRLLPHAEIVRGMPFIVSAVVLLMLSEMSEPGWFIIAAHLFLFFTAAMVCHGALARDRPPAGRLTEFYLWMSVGGALGGLFNGIIAPLVFDRIIEYPLMIVLACICRDAKPGELTSARPVWADFAMPALVGLLAAGLTLGIQRFGLAGGVALMFGPSLMLNYSTLHKPLRFGLGIGAILCASVFYHGTFGRVVDTERDFFGVVRVSYDAAGKFVQIVHGDTVHGRQHIDPKHRDEPTAYYHRTGPIGQLVELYDAAPATVSVGVIGLGAGALAGYARKDESWTFFEIDPIVVRIADDPRYFTFLADMFPDRSRLSVVLGDARVRLASAPDHGYGILMLDAFSSDAIPMHLVTREALALYAQKLAPGGILALHISNNYIDLHPIFSDLALDAGLEAWSRDDLILTPEMVQDGKSASEWIAMAADSKTLEPLSHDARWKRLISRSGRRLWTDDFADLLSVYQW